MDKNDPRLKNLKPATKQQQINGGIAAGKVKKARKQIREVAQAVVRMKIKDPKLIMQLQEKFGYKGTKVDALTAMVIAQVASAINGDTDAYKAVEHTLGDNKDMDVSIHSETTDKLDSILKQLDLK